MVSFWLGWVLVFYRFLKIYPVRWILGLLLFFDCASGFYRLGVVLGLPMGGAWFIASVG